MELKIDVDRKQVTFIKQLLTFLVLKLKCSKNLIDTVKI